MKEKMDVVIKALDDYETKAGLPQHMSPGEEDEMQIYFVMSRNEIESMTPSNAAAAAVRLSQFSFYIQREINREDGRVKWCSNQLDDAIAPLISQYDKFTKHEIKISMIANENRYVATLLKLKRYAEQRVSRLSFLSNSAKHLSETFLAIQRANWRPQYGQQEL